MGLGLTQFLVENISLPLKVEAALGKRSSMSVLRNLVSTRSSNNWTAPGDYVLTASCKIGCEARPKCFEADEGFAAISVMSAHYKIAVEEKK